MNLFPPDLPPGATYQPAVITPEEESLLLFHIDQLPWLTDLKRRVQHYGYRYDYKSRQISADMKADAFPDWLTALAERVASLAASPILPDQAIINEYMPGQGISPHVDCVPCFGDVIASLSLGSGAMMDFKSIPTKQTISLHLERGSMVVLRGESRYDWTHCIPARTRDHTPDGWQTRERRVSLTFRTVLLA